jgi:hypothetical protein
VPLTESKWIGLDGSLLFTWNVALRLPMLLGRNWIVRLIPPPAGTVTGVDGTLLISKSVLPVLRVKLEMIRLLDPTLNSWAPRLTVESNGTESNARLARIASWAVYLT